jgi:Holliday junction resolvasome RuvABC ATP-dependent DNA helicase subunit
MEIQTIDITQNKQTKHDARPSNWKDFIGQKPLVKIIKTALQSAKTSGASL